MKLLSTPNHTAVDYFGIQVNVPKWANYLAMEGNGSVLAFHREPRYCAKAETWSSTNTVHFVCRVDPEGVRAFESLVKI